MVMYGATSYLLRTTPDHTFKYTVEHHRKDGVSEEEFMHWFTKKFLPRAVPIMKKHKILKYAVTDLKVGEAFQAEVSRVRPGLKVNDCDLILEYWVHDLESMEKLISDPEWVQMAVENESDWLDNSRSTIRIGRDTTYLESGAIMNVAGQTRRSRVSASFD